MIYLVFAFAIGSSLIASAEVEEGEGLDIYPYVVDALKQLEAEKNAERVNDPLNVRNIFSVCYEELGCFDREKTLKHLKQLPDTPEHIDTKFLLYTKKNRNDHEFQLLDYRKPETIINSNIDPRRPLKIITHGFGGRNHAAWLWDMKNAFIDKEDANVIIVDWSNGAVIPLYISSTVNTELVGAQIAVLYYHIKDNLGIQEKDLHIIGFSLGAQLMGFVGKRMRMMRGTRPGHITGLDPAGPLYEGYGKDVHLSEDDGDNVDVIHTNADSFILGGLGIREPIGDVDFYPNGGRRQPGCGHFIIDAIKDLFAKSKQRQRVCNHERAVHLYMETILNPNNCRFRSFKCSNFTEFQAGKCFACAGDECGFMGFKNRGSGSQYLETHDSFPYCAESLLVSVRFSQKTKKSYGAIVLTITDENGNQQEIPVTKEKDERLVPGDSRKFAVVLDRGIKSTAIKSVTIAYKKYDGWFAKGTPTFTIGSVSITDAVGINIFSGCHDNTLNDKVPLLLRTNSKACKV